MTMYLSNRDVRSTGYELVEFIDVPPAPDNVDLTPLRPADGPDREHDVVTSPSTTSAPVAITPQRNGPLWIPGPVGITQPDGAVEVVQRAVLCRCGHSGNKPFCDGSHAGVGFTAPGV